MIYEYKEAGPSMFGAEDERTVTALCNKLAKDGWEPVLAIPRTYSERIRDPYKGDREATGTSVTLLFRRLVK